jgi:flagellar hook-length control protein FliK
MRIHTPTGSSCAKGNPAGCKPAAASDPSASAIFVALMDHFRSLLPESGDDVPETSGGDSPLQVGATSPTGPSKRIKCSENQSSLDSKAPAPEAVVSGKGVDQSPLGDPTLTVDQGNKAQEPAPAPDAENSLPVMAAGTEPTVPIDAVQTPSVAMGKSEGEPQTALGPDKVLNGGLGSSQKPALPPSITTPPAFSIAGPAIAVNQTPGSSSKSISIEREPDRTTSAFSTDSMTPPSIDQGRTEASKALQFPNLSPEMTPAATGSGVGEKSAPMNDGLSSAIQFDARTTREEATSDSTQDAAGASPILYPVGRSSEQIRQTGQQTPLDAVLQMESKSFESMILLGNTRSVAAAVPERTGKTPSQTVRSTDAPELAKFDAPLDSTLARTSHLDPLHERKGAVQEVAIRSTQEGQDQTAPEADIEEAPVASKQSGGEKRIVNIGMVRDREDGRASESPSVGKVPGRIDSTTPVSADQGVVGHERTATMPPQAEGPISRSPELMLQVASRIRMQVQDGGGSIRLQLRPENLGYLDIKAESGVAGVVARIVTESESVRQYLENHISSLQQSLQEQGLKVARIDITVQDGLEPRDFASQQQANHEGQQREQSSEVAPLNPASAALAGRESNAGMVSTNFLGVNSTFHTVA